MKAQISATIITCILVLTGVSAYSADDDTLNIKSYWLDTASDRQAFDRSVKVADKLAALAEADVPELIESIWQWSLKNGDSALILQSEILRARHFSAIGLKSKAIQLLNEVKQSPASSDSLVYRATVLLRDLYFDLDAFDRAMELHQEIDWDYAASGSYERYAPESFVGLLYLRIGDYGKAIEAFRSTIQKVRAQGMTYWQMSYVNSLGVVYEEAGMLDSALDCYQRAQYILAEKLIKGDDLASKRYEYVYGLFIGNQAQILAAQGRHLEAIPLYQVDINSSINNSERREARENAIKSLIKLSKSQIATEQYETAYQQLTRADSLLQKEDKPELWDAYYSAFAELEETLGNKNSAYIYMKKLIDLRDSTQSYQKLIKGQNMLIAYESILKDREKEEQEAELTQLRDATQRQRETNLVFIIVIVVALIITGATVYRTNLRSRQQIAIQQKNMEIEAQKQTIEASLKEKDVLLREVNHRVKNNLQIVSSLLFLQSRKAKDPAIIELIKDAQRRVQTMSVIHQKLYQESQFNQVAFDAYLTDLVQQTISSYKLHDVKVATNVDIQFTDISVDQAIPISLIIHELVTNSMKHAFTGLEEGMIAVQLRKDGDHLSLRHEDDGAGIEEKENGDANQIGMKVIELLTQQLNGSIKIVERKPLILQIDVPLEDTQ